MAEDTTPDLTDFLAARPGRGGFGAWCCTKVDSEHMAAIEDAYARGVRQWAGITAWLKSIGYPDATNVKIAYHFERGHHERA